MGWLTALFIALLTGALGLVSAGWIASLGTRWFRVSSFEGASGYMVIGVALMGGAAAFIIGLIVSRVVGHAADPGFFKALGASWLAILTLAALALLVCRSLAHIPPVIGGRQLMLHVEVRLAAEETTHPCASESALSFTLSSVVRRVQRSSKTGTVDMPHIRCEDGRWIVPASVFLFTRRGWRCISLHRDGKSLAGFIVPLPARPGTKYEEWSEWGPRGRPGHPWPAENAAYRFRVERIEPEPSGA